MGRQGAGFGNADGGDIFGSEILETGSPGIDAVFVLDEKIENIHDVVEPEARAEIGASRRVLEMDGSSYDFTGGHCPFLDQFERAHKLSFCGKACHQAEK